VQDNITIRNEIPHQEGIGNIAETHLQAGRKVFRYVPQVPDIAATVVSRQCANSVTFLQ